MATLTVGTGSQYEYQTIAAAVAASQNGDVVLVEAGTYTNDFLNFSDSIKLEAVGGMVVINATEAPPDGKAIITEGATGASVTISGFELTGAAVADNNGAGIRYQGGNLTLTNDDIFNNQEGIMGNPAVAGTGTVSISNCEFAGNGDGSGSTHNIYIGNVATLNIASSLIIGAVVGHEIKSRALNTIITNNVIANGPNGSDSYSIDLPNGGNATITGNVIEKGPVSNNHTFISYGEEGVSNPGTSVTVSSNIFINNVSGSPSTAFNNYSTNNITFSSNQTFSAVAMTLINGPGTASKTTTLTSAPTVNYTPPCSAAATLPGVTCVTVSPANGDVGAKQVLTFTLTFNEAVKVAGTPTLTLNDGGTASYVKGSSTSTSLVFQYTVAAKQNTSALAITGTKLPSGASITGAGGSANLLGALAAPTGRVIVDTTDTRTTISSGTGQIVNAGTSSDDVVLTAGSATLNFSGKNDIAFLGGGSGAVNATINNSSSGLTVYVLNGGADVFNFAQDPTAVVDLLGCIGGFTTAAQAAAALTPYSGGLQLSLGSGHTIDFVGATQSSLTAANFRIG